MAKAIDQCPSSSLDQIPTTLFWQVQLGRWSRNISEVKLDLKSKLNIRSKYNMSFFPVSGLSFAFFLDQIADVLCSNLDQSQLPF